MAKKWWVDKLITIMAATIILIAVAIALFFPTIIGFLIAHFTTNPQDQEMARAAGVCFNILWFLAIAVSNL